MDSTLMLVGSIIIGGLFLIGLMGFYGGLIEHSNEKLFELFTQESSASFMEVIDFDFRRIGSALDYPASAISVMDPSEIRFLGDIDADSNPDTVNYFVSSPSSAASTPNPRDVILYRIVNSDTTINISGGVTEFKLKYYDSAANITTNPLAVKTIEVSLVLESRYPHGDTTYAKAVLNKRITPNNFAQVSNKDF